MKFLSQAIFAILAASILLISPADAQSNNYPTVAALEQAVIPPTDFVSLAKRFRGVSEIPPPPTSPPDYHVGDQQLFWVSNSAEDREFQVSATLRVIGSHIDLWIEDGASVDAADLQALAKAFDDNIYDTVRGLWGSEASPGIDGDPRLHGLFVHDVGSSTAAYFQARHAYPRQVFPHSNQHEMFFFNLDTILTPVSAVSVQSLMAHEFQHMIRANVQVNDSAWLNEGFSTFTQQYLYQDQMNLITSFLSAPQTQLDTWPESQPRDMNYGASALFVDYFYERYGLDALRAVSADPGTGLDAFDHVLRAWGEPRVDEFFADWVLSNFLLSPATEYGYWALPAGLPSPTPLAVVTEADFSTQGLSNQYAADYYVVTNLKGKTSLDIQVSVPDTVQLLPPNAASGQWMWYSNKGDMSDTMLTHGFDLSRVTAATLDYRAWYYLEDGWDYGYLSASTDGGATWQILSPPHATTANPVSNAYGAGYTGQSGGWVDEHVSLDAYTGKHILLRFEVITDDAITQPGMAVDDLSIPAIGYTSDLEADGGGWDAAGWIHTDNRLPQQVWVQAVQQIGKTVQVSRWLAPAENHWTLPLAAGVEQVLLVITPFAPLTTVPMPYTLAVRVNS